MATSRGYGRTNRASPSPRRLTSWQVGPGGDTVTNFSSSQITILNAGAFAVLDGNTVVRLRGEFTAFLRSATAANDGYTGAFGIGITTLDAFTIGATAIPGPLDELDWDGWLYHRFFTLTASGPIVAAAVSISTDLAQPVASGLRIDVDSKAMRKLPENMGLFAALDVNLVGTAAMSCFFNSRMLIKLP